MGMRMCKYGCVHVQMWVRAPADMCACVHVRSVCVYMYRLLRVHVGCRMRMDIVVCGRSSPGFYGWPARFVCSRYDP